MTPGAYHKMAPMSHRRRCTDLTTVIFFSPTSSPQSSSPLLPSFTEQGRKQLMLLSLGKEKINGGCVLRSQHGKKPGVLKKKQSLPSVPRALPPANSSFYWVAAQKASAPGLQLLPLSWGAYSLGGRWLRLLAALPYAPSVFDQSRQRGWGGGGKGTVKAFQSSERDPEREKAPPPPRPRS